MHIETDTSWHEWKRVLGKFVDAGQIVGVSEKGIDNMAYTVGQFLANHVDPGNREQRLIKELWEQGNEDEKRVLASLIARMADTSKTH